MKPDGGPAFPEARVPEQVLPGGMVIAGWHGRSGMSLRDWFAGMALMGWIQRGLESGTFAEDLARWAYKHADAMLKEREK